MTTKWFVFLFYSFLFLHCFCFFLLYCHVSLGRGRAPMRISRLSTAALHSRASRSSSRFPCFKSNLNDVSYVSTTWHLTLHHEFAVSMLYPCCITCIFIIHIYPCIHVMTSITCSSFVRSPTIRVRQEQRWERAHRHRSLQLGPSFGARGEQMLTHIDSLQMLTTFLNSFLNSFFIIFHCLKFEFRNSAKMFWKGNRSIGLDRAHSARNS